MENLKARTVRGGFAKLCGQAGNLALRLGFLAIMARSTGSRGLRISGDGYRRNGIYEIFTSAGLSLATIQKATVTNEQISTLFWINILVGIVLGLLCLATAPVLVAFYHEPRLFWVTVAMGAGFLVLRGGGAAFCASSTPVAVRRPDSDRNAVLTGKLCAWNRHGCRWIWILGSGRFDNRFASRQYRLDVGDRGVDTRHAAPRSGYSLDVAFWWHHYSEYSSHLHRL